MDQETTRMLYEMRLSSMVEAVNAQNTSENCQGMNFEERFKLIVANAYASRQTNKLERLIKQADFSTVAPSIGNIDYLPDRHLDRHLISELATGTLDCIIKVTTQKIVKKDLSLLAKMVFA